jgi:hypothetical protein
VVEELNPQSIIAKIEITAKELFIPTPSPSSRVLPLKQRESL